MKEFILSRTSLIFCIVLFAVVLSRYSVTFLNPYQKQVLPESQFAMNLVGRDLLDGVVFPMFTMLGRRPFNPDIGYGRGLSAVLGTIVLPLQSAGICTESKILDCSNVMYKGLFLLVVIGFFSAVMFLPYGKYSVPAALILITFFLGKPGSLGLDRGNLDILFSLILFLGAMVRIRSFSQTVIQTMVEAILLALMIDTKLTMLPFAVVFFLTSDHMLWFFVIFVAAFAGFSYLPVLFLTSASLWDSIYAALAVKRMFPDTLWTWCASWNHAIFSFATLAIDCSREAVMRNRPFFMVIVNIIGWVLFVIILTPFRFLNIHMLRNRRSYQGIFFLLLCVSTTSVNLLPYYSYAFRLYYCLMCLLIGWYIVKDSDSRRALIWSSVFLLVKGLWIPESKIINIAVFFHFYFLISAAVGMVRRRAGSA